MSINFTGSANIIYKTPENFKKLVYDNKPLEVCRPPHYRFSDNITSQHPKITLDSNSCTIVGVNNTLFHLAPEIREISVIDKFRDFLKSEKDKTGDLTAFIFGARCPRIQKDSFQFAEDLRNVLEEENADYSAIYGKTLDGFLDDLYQDKNQFIFTQKRNIGLAEMSNTEQYMAPSKFKKLLKYYYQVVKISPKHKIMPDVK